MATTYSYSIAVDFYGFKPDTNALMDDIMADVGIVTVLEDITTSGDELDIIFVSALSAPELVALGILIEQARYSVNMYATYHEFNLKVHERQGELILKPTTLYYNTSLLLGGATVYGLPFNGSTTTESSAEILMTSSGTLRELFVNMTDALGVGVSQLVTVRKNGADTTLTVTLGPGILTANDSTHVVPYVSGDLISVMFSTSGGLSVASTVRTSFTI